MFSLPGNRREATTANAGAGPENADEVEAFDELTSVVTPEDVDADFAPLTEIKGGGQPEVDPFQFDSLQAQQAFDSAVECASSGDEDCAVQEYLRAAKIAETAREWYLAAVACQRVGDFLVTPKPPQDLERAFRMYRRAVAAYEECGLFAEARELAYRVMLVRMLHARELKLAWHQQAELRLYWLVAGFGYRPLRVVLTSLIVILIYGLIYWTTNGVYGPHAHGHIDPWQAVYFSGVTFATVGYGDFVPAAGLRLVALSEGFLGAFTIGLFVAVLANRLNRT